MKKQKTMEEPIDTVTISLSRYNQLMAENQAAKGKFIFYRCGGFNSGHYVMSKDDVVEALLNELAYERRENGELKLKLSQRGWFLKKW